MKTKFQYVIKFVCGLATKEGGPGNFPGPHPVVKGVYETSINVYNPSSSKEASYATQVVRTYEPTQEHWGWQRVKLPLKAERAKAYSCNNFLGGERTGFTEGFFVIASPVELDIIAVYTARGAEGQVTTLDVEQIHPKKRAKTVTLG